MTDSSTSATSLTLLDKIKDPADRDAWDRFLRRYGPLISGWCRRWGLQEADAEDVAQEVLLRIFRSIGTYDPAKGSFRSWLSTVICNQICNDWKGRAREATTGCDTLVRELAEMEESRADLLRTLEPEVALERAAQIIRDTASPHHWACFSLYFFEKRTTAEVAAQLGLSISNVYQIASRIKKQIEQEVSRLLNEDVQR